MTTWKNQSRVRVGSSREGVSQSAKDYNMISLPATPSTPICLLSIQNRIGRPAGLSRGPPGCCALCISPEKRGAPRSPCYNHFFPSPSSFPRWRGSPHSLPPSPSPPADAAFVSSLPLSFFPSFLIRDPLLFQSHFAASPSLSPHSLRPLHCTDRSRSHHASRGVQQH